MKTYALAFALAFTATTTHAAEDAQYLCGAEPCKLVYKLGDNYAIEFYARKESEAGFSEGVLLIPADGKIKGEPPKFVEHDTKLDTAALEGMAKTARELMQGTKKAKAATKPKPRRNSKAPDVADNYDEPFVLAATAAPQPMGNAACLEAKDALLDVAMTNVLMRAGDNNPFMGAGEQVQALTDACGTDADRKMGELKEKIDLMRDLHRG